ncbi:uncharacterized protein [Antedon mediterranea]|uniref:uncharacterized protein n=1 Tax=Antedon mediterranea TaxID=105859 RepID=UPI003AF6DC16
MYRLIFHIGLLCWMVRQSHSQACGVNARQGIINGDISIGFIFPFSGPSEDGVGCNTTVQSPDNIQLIEAAIHIVNSINSDQILPGISIGLEAWDTCHLSSVAVDRSIAYLNEQVSYTNDDGTACSSTSLLAGMIGLSDNGPATAVTSLLNEAMVPFVSYGASSSNLQMYDYFLRTVPSDFMDVEVIVKVLVELRWTYVYTFTSADESNMAANEYFQMLAKNNGICVSDSKTVYTNSNDSDYNSIISSFTDGGPNIVVLFSSTADSIRLFQTTQSMSKGLQWVIGREILKDSIGLQKDTINVTRGMLGVAPSVLSSKVEAFQSVFTGDNSLNSQADPWFVDYKLLQKTNVTQNMFVAPLQNAFMLYANALHNAQADQCSGNGVCDTLRNISPNDLMGYLTKAEFVGVDGSNVSFSSNRQLMNQSYDVFNIGFASETQNKRFSVGNLTNNNLTLEKDSIHVWWQGKKERVSDVNATCGSPCRDLACGEAEDLTKVYIPGNIILGGMFGVHDNAPYPSSAGCGNINNEGIQQLEALFYGLDLLNSDSSVLPNITVGIDAFDTCNSPSRAGNIAIKLVSDAEFGGTGSGQRTDASGNIEHVYGIIGPGSDDECSEVLKVSGIYDVPDISYSAQSASLSNTYNYPEFARTVSVETMPIAAIIEILVAKNWNFVQAVITPSSYGWNSYSVLSQQAPPKGICVTQRVMPSNAVSMDSLIEDMTQGDAANVTILLTEEGDTYRFLTEITARNLNGKFYIIAATKWPVNTVTNDIQNGLKGLTVVNMRDRDVTGFKQYFSNLKPSTNLRNPWFREYWQNVFNCSFEDNKQMCNDSMSLKPANVTNPYVGEVVDSLYAMAYGLHTLQGNKCPLQTSVCYDMTQSTGNELFLNMRSANFESRNEDKKMVYFNYQGDGSSDYDIFNYQQVGGNPFEYVKIGSYTMSKLDINATLVKYYDQSGREAPNDGNACVGTCDNCEAVQKEKVAEVRNGDVWIGGFFELNQPGNDRINCLDELLPYNIQHLEAFMWAIDEVNKNISILPDINIGAIAFDTCGLPEKARRDVTNFVSKAVEYRSGYPKDSIRVTGIIGGETSDSSIEIADVITPLNISQISYAATSEVLNDVNKYPYFMRTVSTDSDQARALVDIITSFGWTYVSVLYSDDEYGIDMLREFSKIAQNSDICIAMNLKIQINSTINDFDQNVKTLLTNRQSTIAVLLTSDIDTKQILDAAQRQDVSSIQWLGTETWGSRGYITQAARNTSQRAITIQFQETVAKGFKEYYTNLNPYYNTRNPWFSQFWMDNFQCNLNLWNVEKKYDSQCHWDLKLEDDYVEEAEVTYIANAVKAFAIGLNKTMQIVCPDVTNYVCQAVYNNSNLLKENIRSAQFIGFGGKEFSFDAEGNGPPKYDILNFVGDAYNMIGSWVNGTLTWNGTDWKTAVDNVKSECVGRCTECTRDDEIKVANVSGELQIPAFFSIHEHANYSDCGALRYSGIINLEAFLYALDEINHSETLLPGVKLGTNAFDTCMTSSRAVREASSLLAGLLDVGSNGWSSVVGMVGSETDDITKGLAAVSKEHQYTQVSYGAFSNSFNDLDEYPYLLRALPPSSVSIQVIVDILKLNKWNGVFVIYSNTMENKTNVNVFTETAVKEEICIQQQLIVPRNAEDSEYTEIISEIAGDPDSPIVVLLFTTLTDTNKLQLEATKSKRHMTWIEAGGIGKKPLKKTDVSSAVSGSFYVAPTAPGSIKRFTDYFNILGKNNNRNPWFEEYLEQINGGCDPTSGVACTSPAQLSLNDADQLMVGAIFDSVFAIAYGIDSLLKSTCSGGDGSGICAEFLNLTPDDLFKVIQKVNGKGITGGDLAFTTDGYMMRDFDVYNYQEKDDDYSFVNVGTWSNKNNLILDSVEFYGDDGKTTESLTSTCKERVVTTVTYPPKMTTDESEKSHNSQKLTSEKSVTGNLYYVIVCLCLVGIALTLATMLYFFLKRKTSLVSKYSYSLCTLHLISILFLYILPLLFGIEASDSVCAVQHFIIGLAFAARTASALLMSIRLYRTGKHERRISGEKTTHTNDSSQTILFCCLMLVEVMLIVEWVVIEPLEKLYVTGSDETLKCFYDMDALAISFIYIFVMLLVTLGVTIWARMKVDLAYHPQIFGVMISTIGTMVTFIIWILAANMTDKEEDIPTFISFGAIVTATITLIVIFPPKIAHIYKRYDPRFDDTASILSRSSSVTSNANRYVEPRSTSASNVVVENPAALGVLAEEEKEENTGV